MNLQEHSYDILVQRGILQQAGEHLNLNRRVLVVTDCGVPAEYAKSLAQQCKAPVILTVEEGEGSKSMETFGRLLGTMLDHGFSRKDCVAAVGGGVVGDLSGFAASAYMRGIDFYNIPTTLLSQIDSSIGGKTAINFGGVKNIVGAFYQPKAVLIDPNVLDTLPQRQIANGLAEAVKMAINFDESLLRVFESDDITDNIERIITTSLQIKARVVKEDEKEKGLRKVLNFGHTIGHGIEAASGLDKLYHGECVALGMLPMCGDALRPRVRAILDKLGLPTTCDVDPDAVWEAMRHDKKLSGDTITIVYAEQAGTYKLQPMPLSALKSTVYSFLNGEM